MSVKTRMIFTVPAEFIPQLRDKDCFAAYMIYTIGRGFKLFRARVSTAVTGGLMVLDTSSFKGGGPLSAIISEISMECERMAFSGIVIDSGYVRSTPSQRALINAIVNEASERCIAVYIPESMSEVGGDAIIRIPTALSGGTLRRHLKEASDKYGAERVAVEIERVFMDFTLPATDGTGEKLTEAEVKRLKERHKAVSQFSPELAVNYFTYTDNNKTHFVLHDDAVTIRHKLSAAGELGIKDAFLFYPHVYDIYDEITS